MKNNSNVILLVILFLFGISVGIHLDPDVKTANDDLSYPINREMEVKEITDLRKTNQDMKKRIQQLKKDVVAYEHEVANENITLKKLRKEVTLYELLAGHRAAEGNGVLITLEGIYSEDINIAQIVEEQIFLVRLVNELKVHGAEVIAINNHRITGRSDIVMAGSHININGQAIAPPYQIQVIGNQIRLTTWIEHNTYIFEDMNRYGIRSNIEIKETIKIPAIDREKPIQLMKAIEETT